MALKSQGFDISEIEEFISKRDNYYKEKKMKNILVGVTGGIAAFKSASIVSLLKKKGYNVKVVMTENATNIIGPFNS